MWKITYQKSTCYIRDLKGNDLLTGSRGTDLYSITLQDTPTPNPICLMAKATSSQAWLWHRRLSHLNFDTINLLSKNNIVNGLPKLKFVKDHLCSSCELEKAKRKYTWTHFLRSKDETPEVLIDLLTFIQRGLHAQVRTVRTDKGTKFLNKNLHAFFAKEVRFPHCKFSRHEKTPYHIINAQKPSVKFFYIFGSLCYIVRDGENLDKMKEKDTPPLNIQATPVTTSQAPTQVPIVTATENIIQAETNNKNAQVNDDEFVNVFSTPNKTSVETMTDNVSSHSTVNRTEPKTSKKPWLNCMDLNNVGRTYTSFDRLDVSKGYAQKEGIDFEESFAPIAWLEAVRNAGFCDIFSTICDTFKASSEAGCRSNKESNSLKSADIVCSMRRGDDVDWRLGRGSGYGCGIIGSPCAAGVMRGSDDKASGAWSDGAEFTSRDTQRFMETRANLSISGQYVSQEHLLEVESPDIQYSRHAEAYMHINTIIILEVITRGGMYAQNSSILSKRTGSQKLTYLDEFLDSLEVHTGMRDIAVIRPQCYSEILTGEQWLLVSDCTGAYLYTRETGVRSSAISYLHVMSAILYLIHRGGEDVGVSTAFERFSSMFCVSIVLLTRRQAGLSYHCHYSSTTEVIDKPLDSSPSYGAKKDDVDRIYWCLLEMFNGCVSAATGLFEVDRVVCWLTFIKEQLAACTLLEEHFLDFVGRDLNCLVQVPLSDLVKRGVSSFDLKKPAKELEDNGVLDIVEHLGVIVESVATVFLLDVCNKMVTNNAWGSLILIVITSTGLFSP
ncbi:retrovirus-related pol polyprotein from transposon TNT 1-94 [Tanacetum coccineum]|uniref:Retrovirus-related pol polyprotein from transposon TNT 1-94 n=1 Tax=Tanacetum coccineum TaxID=301880 RepID=A0ABQ5G8K3_9ASTR